MNYNSILPRILQTGAGASQQIHHVLASLGCHKPLIITDRMMVELGYAGRISSVLAEQGIQGDVFSDTVRAGWRAVLYPTQDRYLTLAVVRCSRGR